MSQPPCTLLLTEEPVSGPDLERILALHPDRPGEQGWTWSVLVPVPRDRGFAEVVDHVVLGELREAAEEVRGEGPSPVQAAEEARDVLATTLAALRERGRAARGTVTKEDPVVTAAAAVGEVGAVEVVVVSRPRFVEDTLHRDWASRLREETDVPVLHVYGGTTSVG